LRLRVLKTLGWVLELFVVTLGVASLLALADSHVHLAYILVCFRFQFLIGLIACIVGVGFLRKWRWLLACLVMAIPDLLAVGPCFYAPQATLEPPENRLRVCQINLNCGNSQFDRAVQYIRKQQPDVLLLQEVSPPWLAALSKQLPDYPHRLYETRWDPFGVAIFSRLPMEKYEIKHFAGSPLPTAVAWARWNGTKLKLIDVHAIPALSSRLLGLHKRQIEEFGNEVARDHVLTILAGDFNTTVWSSSMQQFQKISSLKCCANGFGWVPTWPRSLEQWGHPEVVIDNQLFMLPIDQCFVSPAFRVVRYSVGADIGSDHSPVCIDLAAKSARSR
jgi:endonuclease/exonuclease/phosphatase (EEP) superfamily protein YafD